MIPDELNKPDTTLVTADPWEMAEFAAKAIEVRVLRLDKIHPVISGNKWFKLKGHLQRALQGHHEQVLTFGGAWSNHIVATAFAAAAAKLKAIGVIRGERPANFSDSLRDAMGYGMQLEFISREAYSKKDDGLLVEKLSTAYPGAYIIPEGGAGPAGIAGCREIGNWIEQSSCTHIVCAIGTGTMYLGLTALASSERQLIGIPVLKGAKDWEIHHAHLAPDPERLAWCRIIDGYHFGGYARKTPELLEFMRHCYQSSGIPTDFVYTGKLFYAIKDLIRNGHFPQGSRILIIHSGGLQGNRSLPPDLLGF